MPEGRQNERQRIIASRIIALVKARNFVPISSKCGNEARGRRIGVISNGAMAVMARRRRGGAWRNGRWRLGGEPASAAKLSALARLAAPKSPVK